MSRFYGGGRYHALSVIDLVGQKALPDIDIEALTGPHGLAFVGGKVWFTAEGGKVVANYDPASAKIDWIMGTGQNRTHMIYVAPDEKKICTTNVNSATVSVLEKITLPPMGPPPRMRPPQAHSLLRLRPEEINRAWIGTRPSFRLVKATKVSTYRPMDASFVRQMLRTAPSQWLISRSGQ
jgi:hypothetical protein